MYNHYHERLKIPSTIVSEFAVFFGFFFFNTPLVAFRSVLLAAVILGCYYTCTGIQKALLRI